MQELIDVAAELKGKESILASMKFHLASVGSIECLDISKWNFDNGQQSEFRKIVGALAKKKDNEWYKNIDQGEKVGQIIMKHHDTAADTSDLARVIRELKQWIYGNDTATN